MKQNRILITGGNGFVGRALIRQFLQDKHPVRIAAHSSRSVTILKKEISKDLDIHSIQNLDDRQWGALFQDVDTVIHCGAKTKIQEGEGDPEEQFMKANFETTIHLAKKAAQHGVRRFIFLSSMSVYGDMKQYLPFTENSALKPLNPYGLSKLKAEEGLLALANEIEVVIIRPPLVYGSGSEGNFKRLFTLIHKGFPLPLGAIKNKRHFLGINNLVHFIKTCINSEHAKNQIFVVSDKEALSTTELIKEISKILSKKIYLLPVPQSILEFLLKITGLSKVADQLLYNIEIDHSKAKTLLNWEPPYSLQQELGIAIEYFLKQK